MERYAPQAVASQNQKKKDPAMVDSRPPQQPKIACTHNHGHDDLCVSEIRQTDGAWWDRIWSALLSSPSCARSNTLCFFVSLLLRHIAS
mmetsp:Transcript_34865/g.72616  ORF Transcript_34865/g.72616 Transcript_34865/m.72616 type:complete len:89 (+) Transcript_34865:270-536(+)